MVSLSCFLPLHPVLVKFEWCNETKTEIPFVAKPTGEIATGQLDVGMAVECTTPSGRCEDFFVAGIRWCERSMALPIVFLSRAKCASTYVFPVAVLEVDY